MHINVHKIPLLFFPSYCWQCAKNLLANFCKLANVRDSLCVTLSRGVTNTKATEIMIKKVYCIWSYCDVTVEYKKNIYIHKKDAVFKNCTWCVFSYLHLLAILCICVNCGIIIERWEGGNERDCKVKKLEHTSFFYFSFVSPALTNGIDRRYQKYTLSEKNTFYFAVHR